MVALGVGWREGHLDAESALGVGVSGDGGAVGGGDGSDDGEAEAVAVFVVGAARVEALEGLEEPVDVAGGMTGPVLVTVSTALPSVTAVEIWTCPPGTLWPMALSTRLATRRSIRRGRRRGGRADRRLDVQSERVDVEVGAQQDVVADGGQVDWLAVVEPALAAGEGEEGFDEALLLPAGGE